MFQPPFGAEGMTNLAAQFCHHDACGLTGGLVDLEAAYHGSRGIESTLADMEGTHENDGYIPIEVIELTNICPERHRSVTPIQHKICHQLAIRIMWTTLRRDYTMLIVHVHIDLANVEV